MTDRYAALIVTLDQDLNPDDAAVVIAAITALRHVVSADPVVADVNTWMAETRARHSMRDRISRVLNEL